MNVMSYLLLTIPLLAAALAFVMIPLIRKLALGTGLVDLPNSRKVHQKAVPLVGGIAVFLASNLAMLVAYFFEPSVKEIESHFILALVLLAVGIIDDHRDLSALLKLGIQLVLAHFVFMAGIRIDSFYGFFGVYELAPWIQYGITLLVIAGVVNAFNLMDGIDGLAAAMAIVAMSAFTVIAFITSQLVLALVFLAFIGSLIVFLFYNFSTDKKIFMGDAGSLVLGFILVVSAIQLLQKADAHPRMNLVLISVVAVLLLPVLDSIRVFRQRIKAGKSPFAPDKTHLHHLVLSLGMKHCIATITIVGISLLHVVVGYVIQLVAGPTVALLAMVLLYIVTLSLLTQTVVVRSGKKELEKITAAQD
ncbi:MAG: undecaprenyl/decaprenyl-phosphate alpha-N-acetylglucosaminyl 1-phosphate transferase [Bacteroidales bacterium]|nr:undecaprenyl/decaprenyl-phosphate alpha-N-acetylglucosaminyl 1-phosphate transferase [Bacteroidales bacterium]